MSIENKTTGTVPFSGKTVEAPKAEPAKEEVKETAKKSTAKKTTKKSTAKKDSTVKKPVGRPRKVVTEAPKTEIFVQYNENQVDEAAVIKRVEADLKAQKVSAKKITLYIKPQDNACYYVADGMAGRVDLF